MGLTGIFYTVRDDSCVRKVERETGNEPGKNEGRGKNESGLFALMWLRVDGCGEFVHAV